MYACRGRGTGREMETVSAKSEFPPITREAGRGDGEGGCGAAVAYDVTGDLAAHAPGAWVGVAVAEGGREGQERGRETIIRHQGGMDQRHATLEPLLKVDISTNTFKTTLYKSVITIIR